MKYPFFNVAIGEAYKSSFKIQMGAVVICKNKIVGRGHNVSLSTGKKHGDGKHAEMAAIGNTTARHRKDSTVIVCRINRSGDIRMAKPCVKCQTIMKKIGIRKVIYSTNFGWDKMFL